MRHICAYLCSSAAFFALFLAPPAFAQDKKKDEKKEPPRVIMALPLAVAPGKEAKVTLRGLNLDNVSAVRIGDEAAKIEVKINSKGKDKAPDKYDVKNVGDTRIEIEFTLPAGTAAGSLVVIVTAPEGESKAYQLRVVAADVLIDEKEPNEGFKQSQPLAFGQTLRGGIHQNNEVDVFQFTGKTGQKITCEITASRLGSALDPLLTLYDARGNFVAMKDDSDKSRDAILTVTLPSDGVFYLVVQDALDRGESTHPYLLSLRSQE